MEPNLSKSLREGLAGIVARFAVWAGMLALSLTFLAASQAHAGRRVALLLVAEDYSNFDRSAVGVTRGLEIAGLLRARDFDVIVSANPTNATGRAALSDFLVKVKGADLAIVLLIGHGVSASGQTFFLPQNAMVERSTDLFSQGLSIATMIHIAGNAQVAGVCFLMTAPNFPTPLDDVELRPRVDGKLSANVIAAFSNSTRTPASRVAAAASEAADTIATLLRQNSHASLRQFSSACANEEQGMTIGEALDLDLVTTPAQTASQQPPAEPMREAPPPEVPPSPPTPAPVLTVPTAPQPPLQPVDFDVAVKNAAARLFSKMPLLKPGDTPHRLVIDPPIDGYSGARNIATAKIGGMISDLVKDVHTGLTVVPFNSNELANQPLALIGTLQAVNSRNEANGPADAFGICLALIDLKTGRIASKADARAWAAGIDTTPVPFFKDSPIWLHDAATTAYIRSCQGSNIGDSIDPDYADRILVAAEISSAIDAYDAKRYADAADLWQHALRSPGGNQLRAYNGLYLANWRLNRRESAEEAFDALVDYGFKTSNIGVMFLFEPNSTVFYPPQSALPPHEMWLKIIASRGAAENGCLEIVGHTSIASIGDLLSMLRAQYVRDRLVFLSPSLVHRTIVTGVGSREVIVRADKDGPDNAIDRRIEFKRVKCDKVK
jgi:hypothetical protein